MRRTTTPLLLVLLLCSLFNKVIAQPNLLRVLPNYAKNFVGSNDKLYFTAGDSLWKSNGTPEGTVFVKEIGEPIIKMTNVTVGTFVYFVTQESGGNQALWKSNGTSVNTIKIASYPVINPLLNFKNALILGINDGVHGYELWRATAANVFTLVKDINVGAGSGLGNEIVALGDWLILKATTGSGGMNLWKSNATSITSLVYDLPFDDFNSLTVVNSLVFFGANYPDGVGGVYAELWSTTGTTLGTGLVKQFYEADGNVCNLYLSNFINYSNKLFFDLTTGCGLAIENLYSSDGTSVGTVFVKTVNLDGYISKFVKVNNRLVFNGSSQGFPGQLWRSNGTDAGTERFYFMKSEPTRAFVKVGNLLFFPDHVNAYFGQPDTYADYFQLYQSGLHTENTEPVNAIFGGTYAGSNNLTNVSEKLFFTTFNDFPGAPPAEQVLKLYFYDPSVSFKMAAHNSASSGEQDFTAFPNPSVGTFNFSTVSTKDEITTADIYTVDGVFVQRIFDGVTTTGQLVQFNWDSSEMREGVYVCKYICGDETKMIKIVKTK